MPEQDNGGGGLSLPAQPQGAPGLPQNFHQLVFDGFDGLNTKPSRPAIEDQQMYWCDNWMPLGRSNLRTLYDIGTSIYAAPPARTIATYQFANIVNTSIAVVFLDDGSIMQVNTATLASSPIAPAATIVDPTQQIGVAQWGSQYVLAVAPQGNGYFIWDGTLLYQAGSVGPVVSIQNSGLDYKSPPNMRAVGGAGSGATFAAIVSSGGAISQITVAAAGTGYVSGDFVMVAFSGGGAGTSATTIATAVLNSQNGVGAITVATGGSGYSPATVKVALMGGGGFGATATATVGASGGPVASITTATPGLGYTSAPTVVVSDANNPVAQATVTTMPFGIQGTTIETFASRVWISNGAAPTTPPPLSLTVFSAPGNPTDFGTPDGGGSFLSTDSFLRVGYHALRQSNGFLYLIGDSSVNYISGVTTSGTPPTTTFSNQNVDPQIGSPWPDSVQVFSRAIVMANTFGIHALYGGAVQKVSTPLDGIYTSVAPSGAIPKFGTLIPSSAVAIIFGIHVYMLLLPIIDTITQMRVNKLLLWDGTRWFTAQPSVALTRIASQEINSVLTAYGTDGRAIYPLFQTPSSNITKTVQSKFWDRPTYIMTKQVTRLFGLLQENASEAATLSVTVQSDSSSQAIPITGTVAFVWTNNSGQAVTWQNNAAQTVIWIVAGLIFFNDAVTGVAGVLIGLTAQTTNLDMTLLSLTATGQQYRLNL